MKLFNQTDETITIEPGEEIQVTQAATIRKNQYGKLMEVIVEEVR